MKKFNLFLIILIGFLSCDYYDSRLIIQNNGDHEICFIYAHDTILDPVSNNIEYYLMEKITPGETSIETLPGKNSWNILMQKSKNKKLNVFFIELDTMLKYNDWQYIRNNKLYHRYEYSEEELNVMNWLIEYP